MGLGCAALRADDDFAPEGLVVGRDDRTKMADSSGGTYSLGVRPYLDLGDRRSAFLEVRQVNMHRLVSVSYATVHSLEVTVGMNFRF